MENRFSYEDYNIRSLSICQKNKEDSNLNPKNEEPLSSKIPKKIHQIWIQGIQQMPSKLYDNHMLIQRSNPSYEMKLWDDNSIRELLIERHPKLYDLYLNCDKLSGYGTKYTCMSDIGRFVILYEYGGFYLDIDFECSIDFDELYDENDDMIFADNRYVLFKLFQNITYTPIYNLGFCGFQPKHEIWPNIFNIITNINNRGKIGISVDKYLQDNLITPKIINSDKVSTHVACKINNKCFTPKNSSWFKLRECIIRTGCNIHIFIILLIILLYLFFILLLIKFNNQ
jgi:hypothetical protein